MRGRLPSRPALRSQSTAIRKGTAEAVPFSCAREAGAVLVCGVAAEVARKGERACRIEKIGSFQKC